MPIGGKRHPTYITADESQRIRYAIKLLAPKEPGSMSTKDPRYLAPSDVENLSG